MAVNALGNLRNRAFQRGKTFLFINSKGTPLLHCALRIFFLKMELPSKFAQIFSNSHFYIACKKLTPTSWHPLERQSSQSQWTFLSTFQEADCYLKYLSMHSPPGPLDARTCSYCSTSPLSSAQGQAPTQTFHRRCVQVNLFILPWQSNIKCLFTFGILFSCTTCPSELWQQLKFSMLWFGLKPDIWVSGMNVWFEVLVTPMLYFGNCPASTISYFALPSSDIVLMSLACSVTAEDDGMHSPMMTFKMCELRARMISVIAW